MKNQALFRADVIRFKALEVRDEIPLDHGEHRITQGDREALQQFKAISDWTENFMERNNFTSKCSVGEEFFVSSESLEAHRSMLKKKLALWPIEDPANADEVAVLYLFLPSRAVHENTGTSSFVRMKDRLTVVLTVFANDARAPPRVIGKSKRPRGFPRYFNPVGD